MGTINVRVKVPTFVKENITLVVVIVVVVVRPHTSLFIEQAPIVAIAVIVKELVNINKGRLRNELPSIRDINAQHRKAAAEEGKLIQTKPKAVDAAEANRRRRRWRRDCAGGRRGAVRSLWTAAAGECGRGVRKRRRYRTARSNGKRNW